MAINLANNNSLANITALPSSVSGGAMTLLATQTASGSSTISFTSGIDDTYDSYVFKFYDIHPTTNDVAFQFNVSIDAGSNYNVAKTTTWFVAYHKEDNSDAGLGYAASQDLAQGTGFQNLGNAVGNDNDQSQVGTLKIFSPSSTVFVKHFIATINQYKASDYSENVFVAGYANTTSAVNAIRFQMSSGNIDSGVIKLYGVS